MRFSESREIAAVGLYSEIYEPIWFKLFMMIDNSYLYILILSVLLILSQGHVDERKLKLLKLQMDVGGIGHAVSLMNLTPTLSHPVNI